MITSVFNSDSNQLFLFCSDNLIIDTAQITSAAEIKPKVVRKSLWVEREPIDSDCGDNVNGKRAENTQENSQDDAPNIVKHVVKMNNWAF